MTDLELAYTTLKEKGRLYTPLWNYYEGIHPLVYTNKSLSKVFKNLNARFCENWCAVVVDSSADRLELDRFDIEGQEGAVETLTTLWQSTGMNIDSDDVHLACLVTGEACVFVGRDEDGLVEAYYQDPRNCHVFYDTDHPKEKRFACKWWQEAEYLYISLYYADTIEHYKSKKKAKELQEGKQDQFEQTDTEPTEEGVIPVFHFRTNRRTIVGDLTAGVLSLQDAINKTLNDMMVAGEHGAFRQRWAISNADTTNIKMEPGTLVNFPASDGEGQDTEVGEFSSTDLSGYISVMESLAKSMATISKTPKHYLLNQGGDPSGEALIAMESPLVKRTERHIERFTATWREFAAYLLELNGLTLDPMLINPVFDEPATVQPRTQSEMREIDRRAGLPLVTILEHEGWTPEQIAEMQKQKQAEQKETEDAEARLAASAMKLMDRGGEDDDE